MTFRTSTHPEHRRTGPRRPRGAAPRRRPVDRTRRRLRGRVPPAAARTGRAGRRLDRGQRRRRRRQPGRAGRARRDRGLRGARRPDPAPRQARPVDLHRLRQGAGTARRRRRHRRRHRDLRRRADPRPAQRAGEGRQGQGHRPHRADPRHLRPARHQPRRARRRWRFAQMEYMLPRLRGWGESMSRQGGGAGGSGGGVGTRGPGETKIETDRRRIRERMSKLRREIKDMKKIRDTQRGRRLRQRRAVGRDRRLHQRRQVQPAQRAHRRGRAGGERTVRHPRTDHAPWRIRRRPAVRADRHRRVRPAPARPSWSRRSARRWKRSSTPTCWCTWSTAPTSTRWRRSTRCARWSTRWSATTTAQPRRNCWWSTRSTRRAACRWRSCGARCPTRCSSRRAPATASTGCSSGWPNW